VGDLQELSAFGRKYSERYLAGLSRRERAASGKLREDIIADKKGFTLSYELADQDVVDRFEELFLIHDELVLEVTHMLTVKTYTVLMSPFSKERILAVHDGMWSGVVGEFEEV
jgi:hypothetical protein